MDLIQALAAELGKDPRHVENVVHLLDEGNTIPFIARYRKELHGAMDDTSLRTLEERLQYLRGLEERREAVKKSKKLLKFTLDDGSGTDRQILSGIAMYYKPEDLVGKTLVAIVNLPPRKMMGQESQGMLLSAVHKENDEERLNLVMLNDAIPAGAKLY